MFLVGIFSTHITYIILALLYIFGYGSYALNSKKDYTQNIEPAKNITVKKESKDLKHNTDHYYFSYHKDCKKVVNKNIQIKNYPYHIKYKKKNVFECLIWCSYNSSLPNITRPSPIFS